MLDNDEESKILVIYVGVANIRSEDIPSFVEQVSDRIVPLTFLGEIIIIPTQTIDSRIECINPKYITDENLINENSILMKILNENLEEQKNYIMNKMNNIDE